MSHQMKRLILAAIAVVYLVHPALSAQRAPEPQLSPAAVKLINDLAAQKAQTPPVKVAPAVDPAPVTQAAPSITPAAPAAVSPAPAPAPTTPASPVTVNAGPGGETTVSVGTIASQAMNWAILAFGSLLSTIFAAWGVRLFKLAGVQMSDAARARLQEIILNGLNVGAAQATKDLAGKGQVQIKNETVAAAVAYAQAHGADVIKQLGLDPQSGATVEAIKARIETAITDPTVPTPAVLDPPKPSPADPAGAPKTAAPIT